jgi:hypothetical protein
MSHRCRIISPNFLKINIPRTIACITFQEYDVSYVDITSGTFWTIKSLPLGFIGISNKMTAYNFEIYFSKLWIKYFRFDRAASYMQIIYARFSTSP